jgi:CheY-like chemotaxis protein
MVGWLQVLRSPNTNAMTSLRALEGLDSAVQRQCRLAEQLLNAIQIFSPRFRLATAPIVIGPLLDQLVAQQHALIDAKSIHVEVSVADPALTVLAEPARLAEALAYIFQSVILRTGKAGRVEISARLQDHQVGIQIKDGLAVAMTDTVQGERHPGHYLGPGLGLSLAKALAELHGGILDLNLPGDGSPASVVLRLPAVSNTMKVRPSLEPSDDPVSGEPFFERPLAAAAVLALRDGVASIDEACGHLRELGAHVTAADTGEFAFELYPQWAKSGGERLLLWPLADDLKSSIAAISRIRRIEFEFDLPRIPAIALATGAKPAGSRTVPRRELLAAGFDLELYLPIASAPLLAALAPLLGR